MKKKSIKGFTLIELLVVISIIGLLSTIAVSALNKSREKARDVRRIKDIKAISTALEFYYNDYGEYPLYEGSAPLTCIQGIASNHPMWLSCWVDLESKLKSYISKLPIDPSPNKYYLYNSTNEGQGYTLSMTPDGSADKIDDNQGCVLPKESVYCIGINWQ